MPDTRAAQPLSRPASYAYIQEEGGGLCASHRRVKSRSRPTSSGKTGSQPHTEANVEIHDMGVRVVRAEAWKKDRRGTRVISHLRGRGDIAMSTDAILALTRGD